MTKSEEALKRMVREQGVERESEEEGMKHRLEGVDEQDEMED